MSSDKSSLSEEKSRSAVHKCGYQVEILLHLCTNALVLYKTALTEIFEKHKLYIHLCIPTSQQKSLSFVQKKNYEKKSTPFNQFKIQSSMLTKLPDCYKSHIRIWKIWTENVNKTSAIIITWYQISKQSKEISDMVYVHMKQYKWSIQGCKTKWY